METLCLLIHQHHYIYGQEAGPPVELPWPEKYVPRRYMVEAVKHAIAYIDAGKRGIIHLADRLGQDRHPAG